MEGGDKLARPVSELETRVALGRKPKTSRALDRDGTGMTVLHRFRQTSGRRRKRGGDIWRVLLGRGGACC